MNDRLIRGVRAERQWKTILSRAGHLVTKAPSSGVTTASFYDLHSTDQRGRTFLWEVKSIQGDRKKFDQDEIRRLKELVEASYTYRCFPFLVVKFNDHFRTFSPLLAIENKKVSRYDRGIDWITVRWPLITKGVAG